MRMNIRKFIISFLAVTGHTACIAVEILHPSTLNFAFLVILCLTMTWLIYMGLLEKIREEHKREMEENER